MNDKTQIEWTDATWNPVTGCSKVSAGCDHCYAESIAHRFAGTKAYPDGFEVTLRPERIDQPLRWTKPRRIFVNSMSDLFHDSVPDWYIAKIWATMARCPQHTFQVLTKRHGRMRSLLQSIDFMSRVSLAYQLPGIGPLDVIDPLPWPLPNVWLGVSAEDQKWADIRIPALLDTPVAVRFISAEPLLGPIDMTRHLAEDEFSRRLDWVIVGGESGHDARPMHPAWARLIRDQCTRAGVPFLFKQWGSWAPSQGRTPHQELIWPDGTHRPDTGPAYLPSGWTNVERISKSVAGRELDGRTWDQFPTPALQHQTKGASS